MRRRPLAWFVLSLVCFAAALYFWRLGDKWAAQKSAAQPALTNPVAPVAPATASNPRLGAPAQPFRLLSSAGTLNLPPVAPVTNTSPNPRLAFVLRNTSMTVGQLSRSDHAILLENALLDTTQPAQLSIPPFLRAQTDPGTYIVQSRTALDKSYRGLVERSGASIVSYIPNNAYLVRASAAVAESLRADPHTQTVLPYEPYYKLKTALLRQAIEQIPGNTPLTLLLFPDTRDSLLADLQNQGVRILSEDRSPFGPVLKVQRPDLDPWKFPAFLAELAARTEVQAIEPATPRQLANDMSRVMVGVTGTTVAPTNYWGLTGTNVIININDTGVDTNHPDLAGRVYFDVPFAGIDSNGHGTHVAGAIIGSGLMSDTVSNKFVGSSMPAVLGQFRGMAPMAKLFSMLYLDPDYYLQQMVAISNVFISNNSWNYGAPEYDIAAASFDAAVRDSLPTVSGSSPVLYVFSAGNSGSGDFDGGSGNPDTILSPATAKNVITVGALELPRNITNQTAKCSACTNDPATCVTNRPWLMGTDSSDQVADYSSRGNVGIGVEGEFGRFKPDLVAPGSFVISTRSTMWDEIAYYNRTSHVGNAYADLIVDTNSLWQDLFFLPCNAVQVEITVSPNRQSPIPFPDMVIYLKQDANPTNSSDIVGTNRVVLPVPPLGPVGVDWHYAIGNPTTQSVSFNVSVDIMVTNQMGNHFEVLSNLNNSLNLSGTTNPTTGTHHYRFESGTSLSAADVSGTLGLMQEFFQQRLKITNSPAMMKALLINGARSIGGRGLYDFQVNSPINFQGWGQVNLPTSLQPCLSNIVVAPLGPSSVYLFDQNSTNALATGQRHTFNVKPDEIGLGQDLRVTLVWTDPPGNPVAGVKLVNDLDLIVTNLESGEVYFGNDIVAGSDVNMPWDPKDTNTTRIPIPDTVNNVENVYLHPSFYGPLGSNYSITVVGRRVNANAVTAHTNDVAQDFALVISSGDGDYPTALSLTDAPIVSTNLPFVTSIANMFTNSTSDIGGILLGQHVGANSPLIGTNQVPLGKADGQITLGVTNQWHFYVLTNDTDWTNAAFLTFLPPTLSVPRMGVTNVNNPTNMTRPEADIDLYVSPYPGLTNLDPVLLANPALTFRSQSRLGTETIVLSNATRGVFYIGVKSEDQQAAEYGILAIVSEQPFGEEDRLGNQTLRGFPVPVAIPDGSPQAPRGCYVFAVSVAPTTLHRVVVTNVLTHQLAGDLVGILTHGATYATLNNHTTNIAVNNQVYVYDDSDERNVFDLQGNLAHRSDGPGSLHDFAAKESVGQWLLTQIDNAAGFVGREERLTLWLEKQQDLEGGVTNIIEAGACREDYVEVPFQATNLTIAVTPLAGSGPVSIQVCRMGTSACKSLLITNMSQGATVTISTDIFDDPPLEPGMYSVRQCNLGPDQVKIYVKAFIYLNTAALQVTLPVAGGPTPILDDAVTYSSIFFTNHLRVSDIDVGVLFRDSRISDLALSLVSPSGTRVLLYQNRGALSSEGLGSFTSSTNALGGSVMSYTNLLPVYTNDFNSAAVGLYAPGARFQGWSVLSNIASVYPDYTIPWFTNNYLVLANSVVSNTLPTISSLNYRLTFKATHAPYLVGTVGWWPLDGDGQDMFGGLDALMYGDVVFSTGKVSQAFFGDGSGARMLVPRAPEINVGRAAGFSVEGWIYPINTSNAVPLVSWNNPTNERLPGVSLWLSANSGSSNRIGSLRAALWDTNGLPFYVDTIPAITNVGWQHVALTYDASTRMARIYTNGLEAAARSVTNADFLPQTGGDFFIGYDTAGPAPGKGFYGGLDEFGLYSRALSSCEVGAIYHAGGAGKYGTNVLSCPVALQLALYNMSGNRTFIFTNAIIATNVIWQTNSVDFINPILAAITNGPGTNLTGIVLTPLDPNVAVDDFVLSAIITNTIDGLLHFTENTNLALIPIKFAPSPYSVTSFPPVLTFSNHFERAQAGIYPLGSVIVGSSNAIDGQRDWTNVLGSISVISNLVIDAEGSNWVALSTGALESSLPTIPGRRYRLAYSVRGPCAVGWWNGSQNWLNHRALDLIGGNDGAFYYFATNATVTNLAPPVDLRAAYVDNQGLFFAGMISNGVPGRPDLAGKIELGDPDNLKFTNGFTIEAWIKPIQQTNDYILSQLSLLPTYELVVEQIFSRGDLRDNHDPYFLALEQTSLNTWDILFHIEGEHDTDGGVILETANHPVVADRWQHLAAVFDQNVHWTNNPPWPTNELRLYLDGVLLTNVYLELPSNTTNYIYSMFTDRGPFRDLEPRYSPGVAIGNRARSDASQPFRGYMDELTVYARALTAAEIEAIALAGTAGKADTSMPPRQSLAKVAVSLDNVLLSTGHGDNSEWSTYSVPFTASRTNTIVNLRGLLPGTLIDKITLTEMPVELSYLPEESLDSILGEDAFGEWRLEIWDTRVGGDTNALLVNWQLHFTLLPTNPPPTIYLTHGIPYTNSLVAHGSQNFVIEVPQWALRATNVLLHGIQRSTTNLAALGVLCDTNYFPSAPTNLLTMVNALFWPPVLPQARNILTTNAANSTWPLLPGGTYYLTVTNTNPYAVEFGLGVWFDITPLTNCQLIASSVGPALSSTNYITNFVSLAGIPRYFQFEVPADDAPLDLPPRTVAFWLGGANTNLTIVMSEHLPLPDLTHYDYISRRVSTNDEVIMVLTNSTPFQVQSNRWYVGVFNTETTNVPFRLQACVISNYPVIISLTNTLPYTASAALGLNTNYLAPSGPPRWFFFKFAVTNAFAIGSGMLFELYDLSGDVDLLLQRDVPPTQAPYFDASYWLGPDPEEIVVRPSSDLADLRGSWYLGLFNNETNKVAYSLRATLSTNLPGGAYMLLSKQSLLASLVSPTPSGGTFIRWNSVVGENYVVQKATALTRPMVWNKLATVSASTPVSTFEIPVAATGLAFYRLLQVPTPYPALPPVTVRPITPPNPAVQVQVSWPTTFSMPPYLLQFAIGQSEVWYDYSGVINTVGTNYITLDNIRTNIPTLYRLFPGP